MLSPLKKTLSRRPPLPQPEQSTMRICETRFIVLMKAAVWRVLMAIGMKFHHHAEPKPPSPSFKIIIPSRISSKPGRFKLVFYVPRTYADKADHYKWPVVVNFHGGGFTLGTGTDDARWAASVVQNAEAVLVSVEYRLAPRYPFSVGVEDCTDALIYLASHADELRLDPHRIALSGFSAGGNFAFTVPIMLYDLQHDTGRRSMTQTKKNSSKSSSLLSLLPRPEGEYAPSDSSSTLKLSDLEPTDLETHQTVPDLTIRSIVSFYPPTDFRTTRDQKRLTNPAPGTNLPSILTNLFDECYMPQNKGLDFTDPYLSPAAASDSILRAAYPDDIVLYTCEHDMLNAEGVAFGARLGSGRIGKTVKGGLIRGVPHAFDRKPNPITFPKSAEKCYAEACAELKRVFGGRSSTEERRQLDESLLVKRFEDEEGGGLTGEVSLDENEAAEIKDEISPTKKRKLERLKEHKIVSLGDLV